MIYGLRDELSLKPPSLGGYYGGICIPGGM